MIDWIALHIFSSIWGWLGIGGLAIAGLLVVAYLFPPFRKNAIIVAAAIGGVLALSAKAARDARAANQRKWDKAEAKSVERGHEARADAESQVASGKAKDKFDREDL